jgi:hypothetical protein
VWFGDDQADTPPDWKRYPDYDCPFLEKDIESSGIGMKINLAANGGSALYVLIVAIVVYRLSYTSLIPARLLERTEMKLPDMILIATILVEFFQFIYLSSPLKELSLVIAVATQLVSIDLYETIDTKDGRFWYFTWGAFGVVLATALLFLF